MSTAEENPSMTTESSNKTSTAWLPVWIAVELAFPFRLAKKGGQVVVAETDAEGEAATEAVMDLLERIESLGTEVAMVGVLRRTPKYPPADHPGAIRPLR